MLPHPTLDKLQTLRLHGMLKALNEQLKTPDIDSLSFEERLGLLVDRELTERDDKRLSSRLRQARLKHNACLEDIDYRSPRGLDKALILQLSGGQWLRDGLNLIISGPTGVGKTWLACALAHQACREGYSVRYLRLPRLLEELGLAHGDGRFAKLMSSYAKTDLLILDEPTDGLDPNQKHQVRQLIQGLARDKIVIISTHILEEVTALCTRAVVIAQGRLLADGTPLELESRSKHHQAVTLVSDAPLDEVALAALPGVAGVERNEREHSLTVLAQPGHVIFPQVNALIAQQGWAVTELDVERGRLDEVFRNLTRGEAL